MAYIVIGFAILMAIFGFSLLFKQSKLILTACLVSLFLSMSFRMIVLITDYRVKVLDIISFSILVLSFLLIFILYIRSKKSTKS